MDRQAGINAGVQRRLRRLFGDRFGFARDGNARTALRILARGGNQRQNDFFELLRTHTLYGFVGNPSYGGNRDRVGWKLIGFEDRMAYQPPFGYYDGEAK